MDRRVSFIRYFPSLLPLAAAAFVYQPGNENAHIAYEGDVSAIWRTVTRSGHDCTLRLGPQNHSWFYVGVHPDWDPNPIFFEISHVSSTVCDLTGERCVDYEGGGERRRGETVYTHDEIYGLDFASEVQRALDFGKAQIDRDGFFGEDGYVVRLERESWLENSTFEKGVVLRYRGAEQEELELEEKCFLDAESSSNLLKFKWTGVHDDFSVHFSFTNNYANATFYIKLDKTELTLTFTGSRNRSDETNSDWNLPEVDLDTSNRQVPRFNWRTGGPVVFSTESATATSTATHETGSVQVVEPMGMTPATTVGSETTDRRAARPQSAVPSSGGSLRMGISPWRIRAGLVIGIICSLGC
ncbi:hypothetical protein ABW21_db0207663 [Orbilia brochopaga]|nr:hypothetical protein ABW21_db0207663 [Drechslerella brochopaga]